MNACPICNTFHLPSATCCQGDFGHNDAAFLSADEVLELLAEMREWESLNTEALLNFERWLDEQEEIERDIEEAVKAVRAAKKEGGDA